MSTLGAQTVYPRGSEWRKWDLQVHTPYSALNNGFGPSFPVYAKKLLTAAVESEVAVVGITDYFCIEGYKQLKALLDDATALKKLVGAEIAEKAKFILFLPNVELRTTILYSDKGKDSRVNFHVVFSDKVSVQDIEENFLRELKFTAESDPDNEDERWSLTLPSLETLGKKLQAEHEPFRKDPVLFTGMMNAVLHHENITSALTARATLFKDNFVFCLPCDEDLSNFKWNGQGHLMRKLLVQKSHLLFSSNANTREFALGKKHLSPADYVEEFKGFKPCFHGSDAHNYAELFTPKGGRHTWVKADPTFHGLRQTLHEPEDRVFLGEVPPSIIRVHKRATRIISSLKVKKVETSKLAEIWFNSSIPLNPELVAIIGNKGAGKSALSDIIGLLGNTPRHDSFSFLQSEKFRSVKNNKAKHFTASITWADATSDECDTLDANPSPDAVEKVKYIPQSYLEEICNEVGKGKRSRFYAELEQVIFSHVPEADKGGFATLDELLSHRGEETTLAIGFLIDKLKAVNAEIIACEERLSPHHKANVEAQLTEKKRELEAHDQNRPKDVQKPEEDPTVQQQAKDASEALEVAKAELEALEQSLAETRAKDTALGKRKLAAEKLLAKLDNFQRQANAFLSDTKREFEELGLTQTDLIAVKLNTSPLNTLIHELNGQRATIASSLDPGTSGSLQNKRGTISGRIETLQTLLSAPQRAYQTYLQTLKEWETARKAIVGDGTVIGSVAELEAQLVALQLLPEAMRKLKREQQRKALEVYEEKKRLRGYYASYYGEVQKFLVNHPLAAGGQFRLTFDVTITQTEFANAFLNRINRRKTGPFMGEEEGASELKRLLDSTNFDSPYGTLRFVRTLITKLNGEPGRKLDPKEQLRGGFTLQELYDYIFSLEYLSPIYNLRWDGKTLEQLSPGERGNLLLIFYLLVDRDDLPLVIDQPEENLDNQTVFKTLVPCIKNAKKRRQIIIVTHNPNLAVVCDAEQIVCAEIRKDHGNEVSYLTGAIEDPAINQKIVDILEGTRPAFDKRDDKYQP